MCIPRRVQAQNPKLNGLSNHLPRALNATPRCVQSELPVSDFLWALGFFCKKLSTAPTRAPEPSSPPPGDPSTYFRKGFGLKNEVQDDLAVDYDGQIVGLDHILQDGDRVTLLA